MTSNRILKAVLGILMLLMLNSGAFAQGTTSSIRGTILDDKGAPVTNAVVVVEDTRTGVQRTFNSNDRGVFLATRLGVGGPYTVTVAGAEPVVVQSIALGDTYNLTIDFGANVVVEEVLVTGTSSAVVDVAAGPAATFSSYDLETTVAFNRDIVDVYGTDPRVNIDNEDDGFEVNCGGKHPRFNSVTLDGVSQNDRFGLNSNGYSTAVGQPFPYDAIEQVAVELAPFDVTYGGFSACNINSVTKSGTNEWDGNVFFEWTSDDFRGDSLGGTDEKFTTAPFNDHKRGLSIGGPIIKDKLWIFGAYEESDKPRFLAIGYDGSGNGVERSWLSESDFNRLQSIASSVYNYDPGTQPSDGAQEDEKYLVRLDWNINDQHNAALIHNFYDGFQDRNSDGDDNEFEFSNHFYVKGSESTTTTLKLASQWTDAFSTEVFFSTNEMIDSQVTVGPKDFADFQISIDGRTGTAYLGADDSRQANKLNTESDFFKLTGTYLWNNHVFTAGFESEELTIFNQFVQHSNGGEYDFFDNSGDNPPSCDALTAQQRFDDPLCELSGIDGFELGRPSRIYYGSGGGTNNPDDAAALFSNTLNSIYLQDEIYFDAQNLTVVAGLRYDYFDSSDRPNFNQAFTDANGGLRNDGNIDGLDLLMPRVGFTWEAPNDVIVRGGIGRYSGGNPNVWISNAWSNDGLTNVQSGGWDANNRDSDGNQRLIQFYPEVMPLTTFTVLPGSVDSLALSGAGRPGFDVPQSMVDFVAASTAADANTSNLVLIDPNYEQPSEWKFAIGATFELPWFGGVQADVDYLHTEQQDSAFYIDLSQDIVGMTALGQPIYDYVNGRDNYMLSNANDDGSSDVVSFVLRKDFADLGLDVMFGYSYTDAKDVVPMTSSVAGSNFDNTALLDINNPTAATSNYEVPHRMTFRASWARDLFGDMQSRVTLLGYAAEGQGNSFVMSGGDLEGDGFFGRHLLYVPTNASDPNVDFIEGFPTAEFFAWADRVGAERGQFVARNSINAKWSTRFDLRIDQEIPTFIKGTRGRAFFKLYNLGNFINDDWGKVNDAFFFAQEVVDVSIEDAMGEMPRRYIYEDFSDRSNNDVLENRSLWEARMGFTLSF